MVSLFLQDYVPGYDKLKFNLKFIWAQGFPAGYLGVRELKAAARLSSYRRVDLGIIYHLRKGVDKVMERKMFSWMKVFSVNVDLFNLLNIKNENSYYWVESMTDGGFLAVPNYLTGFRPNVKIQVDF